MKKRTFWLAKIETLWRSRSLIWLAGVRRAGKTSLCQSIEGALYFDCELPRIRQMLSDSEGFLGGVPPYSQVVLDEIHRLANPSEILKIAADHFPKLRIIATGSSTLSASKKFKDTLAGRKHTLWLTPMILADLVDFGDTHLERRYLQGGLPPFWLADPIPEQAYQEWLDAYWAKDIQELFRLTHRDAFLKLFELLHCQSGGLFDATQLSKFCEISRQTVVNYLKVFEETYVMHVLRPYHSHTKTEIISTPKVYAFDTGFMCYLRGWYTLRPEDKGLLWEHIVLNELHATFQTKQIHFWRDKAGHEIDFIWLPRRDKLVALECKLTPDHFEPIAFKRFYQRYPKTEFKVVCPNIQTPFWRDYGEFKVQFISLSPDISPRVQPLF